MTQLNTVQTLTWTLQDQACWPVFVGTMIRLSNLRPGWVVILAVRQRKKRVQRLALRFGPIAGTRTLKGNRTFRAETDVLKNLG